MKLRDSRSLKQPELMIIPMIDIMFFLLVFFMLSTMYMVDLKTIPIKLPKAEMSVCLSPSQMLPSFFTETAKVV